MEELLKFLLRIKTWVLFVIYVALSCVLLFRSNSYQKSVYLTSANVVSSTLRGGINNVSGYFNLRQANQDLLLSNASLENEVLNLRQQLADLKAIYGDSIAGETQRFSYIPATVINNSTRLPSNYFTINRGLRDGVQPGMGVVDHNGVVGIVNVVGSRTSRIISILNCNQQISVKLKDTGAIGTLRWRGLDPHIAYMEDVPRHVKYHPCDTIVTSGASTTFPPGIIIGTVMSRVRGEEDNYFTLKVRLQPDFSNLSAVRVLKDAYRQELDTLAKYDIKNE